VEVLGEGLRETIGERLDHDRLVIIVLGLESRDERVGAQPGGDRKRTEVVAAAALNRRHEVGERSIGFVVGDDLLLSKHVETDALGGPGLVLIEDDVVANRRGRPEPVSAACGQPVLANDAVEQRLGIVVQLSRGRAVLRVIENPRHPSLQLPRVEEERPVDEGHELGEPHLHLAPSHERRHRHVGRLPVDLQSIRLRRRIGQQGLLLTVRVLLPQRHLLLSRSGHETVPPSR
jgi:hypothetical protein